MKTKFTPIDYDYFDWQGKNYAKVIGRDEKGRRVCIIDSCPVYFWVVLKKDLSQKQINYFIGRVESIQLNSKGRETKVEKVELLDKRFLDKDVKALKIHVTNYKDMHEVASELGDAEEIEKRRGYDLGYNTHYIIESELFPLCWYEIEGQMLNNSEQFGGIDAGLDVDFCINLESKKEISDQPFTPKVLAYDIETDSLKPEEGEILMVSLAGENFKKVISWKVEEQKEGEKIPDYVEIVEDEAELLRVFVERVRQFSPDVLVGYYSDAFDLPFIKERARKLKVKLPLGLDNSQPKFSRGNTVIGKIKGIVHIDILKFIKTAYAQYMKSESLSLNEVSKEFLGDTKKDFNLKHSSQLKEGELNKYYEYNLQDSVLTKQLFEKFWPDMLEFVKTTREPIFDLSRAGLSKYMESYILHNLKKFNEIPEKKPGYTESAMRKGLPLVKGAYVYEPTPGLYEDIAMFDFTSMHTSILITHNISKSTFICEKTKTNESGEKETEYEFSKEMGFFPELLKEIFELRKKHKAEYKKNPNQMTKARSNAFKVLSASAHGYIGFYGARYFSHEASSAVLSLVRKYNKETIQKIKDAGHKVIYGDTDSTAFLMKDKSVEEIKELLKKLNDELPGVMHLELEGFFKRGLWVTTRDGKTGAKKKYAMIDENNEMKIRGFETVRRDWCKLARNLQSKVIKLILTQGNEEAAVEYVKEIIKDTKTKNIDKKDLIIKTQLKKPIAEYKAISPHVVAARKMIEQGIPIEQGGIIEYYISEEKGKLVRDKVKLAGDSTPYDVKYYLEKQILPAIENIFQVFDVDTKVLIDGKKQMSLMDF